MALHDLPRKLTYEDYLLFPDDGLRHEILDGEHYVTPAPSTRHQIVSGNLYFLLRSYLTQNPLGLILYAPVDVILSLHDIAQPDLVFISHERMKVFTEKNIQGAPDLAIEILSKSTRHRDEGIKLKRYELLGLREYWMLDPGRNAARIFRRKAGRLVLAAELSAEAGDVLTSPLFPGLEIALAEAFA